MSKRIKFAILGAGNGGQVMAAHLTMMGFKVNLYEHPNFKHVIEPIIKQGGIYFTSEPRVHLESYFARLNMVTSDLKEAIEGVDIINIIIPAFAHKAFCKELAPLLKEGQIVIFHPGYLGSLLLARTLKEVNPKPKIYLAEAQTMLYNARNKNPAHAWSFGIKKELQLAAFPGKDTKRVVDAINTAFPQYVPARDILETHLNNISIVFHPAPTILNAGRVESTKGNFRYYWDGATDSVARFMETIDEERLKVAEKMGLKRIYCKDWLKNMYSQYGAKGNTLREVLLNCQNYKTGATPSSLKFTYISQDAPYGLVPMISLAKRIGIETPYSNVTVQMASYLNEVDYWTEGHNQEYTDIIQNMNLNEMVKFFQEGEK